MPWIFRALLSAALLVSAAACAAAKDTEYYNILYKARLDPARGVAHVSINLKGDQLPGRLTLHLNPERHKNLTGTEIVSIEGDKAIWEPAADSSSVSYDFVIDEKKSSGRYDSRITDKWSILRSDKLIPPIAAKAPKRLKSRAILEIEAPEGWNVLAPYNKTDNGTFKLKDPGRRFIRPKGWLIAGHIGSRQDVIDGTDTVIAGPLGKGIRRQDTLAFLSWTLPELKKVFPQFPKQLLVVIAGDPMWRGGLSGTRSLFMHADRPLISGNRTSSMLHELVHVATGIRGDKESDWIVEGIAEYYSLETLRRTGGISQRRYDEALAELADWGEESPNLLVKRSSGPITARAVVVLHEIDQEIQKSSDGKRSLDDVVTALAEERGKVTLDKFRSMAEEAAGGPLPQLERTFLSGKKKP
ncbi:hypothetical protein [Microbulbifer hydrolyticus]|uniref:Peptidase M61 catalytic domain-containing protein n=1 Tax=Microbulbifer hydrolyticus TaxID=48074 RepID=A0A6P1TBM2_9GAMM|nr:hypothetical protein [Microbulbifer hydrolyticus]MBB5210467.1 hypothetical protein [Microbulbifer hydrolyticus]QHQ39053.1 hypothetical protein GTQ55_08695 [Microbulbifer hydrolyticus]